jgi:hypothetical protein
MTSPPVTDRSYASRAHGVKATLVMAVLLLLAGLIAWAMWRGGKWFHGENGGAWQYQPATAADANRARPAIPGSDAATVPPPGAMPDPATATTPNLATTPLRKPSAAIRMPLPRPVPQQREAAAAPATRKRHHRSFLGLGKLWHWIRRDHHKAQE